MMHLEPLERLKNRREAWRKLDSGPAWLMAAKDTTIAKLDAEIADREAGGLQYTGDGELTAPGWPK